jgi:purine catabolism regulator
LARAHEEAKSAARLGFSITGPSSITRYDDLGVLRILGEIGEDSVERHLSNTLTDDANFRNQFFETFGAFAAAGYNKAAAARCLFVHVNTLKYRLERIKQVTGLDPFEHRGRFALECSLRLMELQAARLPA